MDPTLDSECLGTDKKNNPIEEPVNVGNIARSWQWRERGINPPNSASNKTVLENVAEDILIRKSIHVWCCHLPGSPRSTFLMVFSPDGTKVASTHGNHNVYVTEVSTGKHVRVLQGHPRTPWCVTFHPSHTQLIGSGCLAGQVRVWDITNGGSESWFVPNQTVIASVAFHPRVQLLVIATYNELFFWDWSKPAPFTKVSTNSVNEKVRYVAFDALGYKLITGISCWNNQNTNTQPLFEQMPTLRNPQLFAFRHSRRDESDESMSPNTQEGSIAGSSPDVIVNSYHSLVQRYDSLARSYQRLFMFRQRMSVTPPPPTTTDRGTDPMETDSPSENSSNSRATNIRPSIQTPSTQNNQDNPTPGTSRGQDENDNDPEGSSSRLLNLDALSFDSSSNTNNIPHRYLGRIMFGSRPSAFQPLNETTERSFRTVDQNERTTRLLPNPFFSTSGTTPPSGLPVSNPVIRQNEDSLNSSNTSRTSLFSGYRTNSMEFSPRNRRLIPLRLSMSFRNRQSERTASTSTASTAEGLRNSSQRNTRRYSRFNLLTAPADSQSINESLDLIRHILADSGTQLVDLITRVSLSTLADMSSEENLPNISDDSGLDPFRIGLALSSSSDSDSDHSIEVNIFRTPNSTFREEDARNDDQSAHSANSNGTTSGRVDVPTDRMVFDLNRSSSESGTFESGIFNVLSDSPQFHVRSNSASTGNNPGTSTGTNPGTSTENNPGTSTKNNTGTSTENNPGNSTGNNPGTSTGNNPGTSTGNNPGTSTENKPGTSTEYNAGASTENSPGTSIRNNPGTSTRNNPGTSTENIPGTSSGSRSASLPQNFDFNPNRPSTSRDNGWSRSREAGPEETYRKVKAGVIALQKHTIQLTDMWLKGKTIYLKELRIMWDNLRRRITMIHRENNSQETPSYFTRPLIDRCRTLSEMAEVSSRTSGCSPRSSLRAEELSRNAVVRQNANNEASQTGDGSTSNENRTMENDDTQTQTSRPPHVRRSPRGTSSPPLRRRLLPNGSPFRWRPQDDLRRRARIEAASPSFQSYSSSTRTGYTMQIEITATRHEIRMRAMQVLSVMFNSIMMCLEERGLSQLIISMLRLLKKALAFTCLMLMTTSESDRIGRDPSTLNQSIESLNVTRIQNIDHTDPVNVDGPEDSPSCSTTSDVRDGPSRKSGNKPSSIKKTSSPSSQPSTSWDNNRYDPLLSPMAMANQKWSNRLAVQIAAANRNTSITARNRRDLYVESRRLKALHRTNPSAHPIIKKRVIPPVTTHRIPSLRLPNTSYLTKLVLPRTPPASDAEPSTAPVSDAPTNDNPRPSTSRLPSDVMDEFEQRINLIRLAHMQAVRLRNAARNRFRRLEMIRLYTPSFIREINTMQGLGNSEGQQENLPPAQNEPEQSTRRPFAPFRSRVSGRERPFTRTATEPAHFHTVLNNVAMPLMQVNEMQNNEAEDPQAQRLPRIHEYLQPIILAQNAMVVDDDANGDGEPDGGNGGAGAMFEGQRRVSNIANFLESGIITETITAPAHRIQAWDFTTGDTPDIANSTKNIVVGRCRIHNDASIDISKDGKILVALHPVPRLRSNNHWFGVYSLEWSRLGQCLHTAVLEQTAVSVALSPTARYLAVGLGSRRFTSSPHMAPVFALLYRLGPENSERTALAPVKELIQNWEPPFRSLNCFRWAPQPGQGYVYANNTGQLFIIN